jgi:L-seryl-tRNA(Ser) seleniumtransferase
MPAPVPSPETRETLSRLPSTDRVLRDETLAAHLARWGHSRVARAVREATEAVRRQLRGAGEDNGASLPTAEELHCRVREGVLRLLEQAQRPTLRRAINATGVVLHTGLGRSVLGPAAVEAVAAAAGHCLLEVDPESGERGNRLEHLRPLLRELTGAEDALAVNNNAAAVYLAVGTLAAGREVVISRGQLVEIGGSFRIPDVIRAAGARLVEVGTTNRTRLSDYEAALTPETALLLRVHPSNFRVVGFTEEPPLAALTALGRRAGIPVMDDLGSGALVDLTAWGVPAEPTVAASVRSGADVVTFSGDKLLGGPQAGLVVGRGALLEAMRRHPLMRVLRLDKLVLAGLEATLRAYRSAEPAAELPTLRALMLRPEQLQERAARLAAALVGAPAEVELLSGTSQVGGGALPGEDLPTTLVVLRAHHHSAAALARRLRTGEPSVWGRIRHERLLLDPRTVAEHEMEPLVAALRAALAPACDQASGENTPCSD